MALWNSSARSLSCIAVVIAILTLQLPVIAQEKQVSEPPVRTQIVLLGTGNPPADPDRSGPATAIIVNGTPYLVDVGAGVIRRAKAAVADRGISALGRRIYESRVCDALCILTTRLDIRI
jgi:hypothetical protein